MRTVLRLVILIFFFSKAYAQKPFELNDDQKDIDSLKKIVAYSKSDSVRCIASFELSRLHIGTDLNKVKVYVSNGNALIKKNQYLHDISYYYNAPLKYYTSQNTDAYLKDLIVVNQKLLKYKNPEAKLMRLKTLMNISVVYGWKNNEVESKKIQIEQAIPLAKACNNNELLGSIYLSLSNTFFNESNQERSDYYGNLAVKTLEAKKLKSTKYAENLFLSYIGYAQVLSSEKKFNEAEILLNKAFNIIKRYPNSILYCNYYYSRGLYNLKKGNSEKGIYNVNMGIEKALQFEDYYLIYKLKLLKIEILKQEKKYSEVKNLLVEVLKNDYQQIDEKKENYKDLAKVSEKLKEFENSVRYYNLYIHLNDSLNELAQKKQINSLEAKYNSAENKNKIKQLKIEKDKATLIARIYRMRYITFASVFIVAFILLIVLVKNFRTKNKLAKTIALKNKNEINSLKREKEIEVMQAMIDGEEAERKRIARDLHDGIGSRLSALKMKLQSINDDKQIEMKEFLDPLSISITELRQIAFNLMPETLIKLGLQDAINDLCHSLSNNKVSIRFHANEINNTLTSRDQITIFRIVQELINNALKHANCSEIMVDCSQNKDLFLITVEDNGDGFNANDLNHFEGLGLKNIKNRIEMLNGFLDVSSILNKGTVFNIELCINK